MAFVISPDFASMFYSQNGSYAACLRALSSKIPAAGELGLPAVV